MKDVTKQLRLRCTPITLQYIWNEDPRVKTHEVKNHEVKKSQYIWWYHYDIRMKCALDSDDIETSQNQGHPLLIWNCISWEIICRVKWRWKIFEFELWKIVKYERNGMQMVSKLRQKYKKNHGPKYSTLGPTE